MSYVTEEMRRVMASKVLSVVAEYPGMIAYRLGHADGSWVESTRILITRQPLPEQIIITGDLCPGDNGVMSDFGYGLGWFGSRKSEGYLCEKFLRREFVPAAALRALKHALEQEEQDAADPIEPSSVAVVRVASLKATIDDIGDEPAGEASVVRNHEAFYEFWGDVFGGSPEDEGFDYNPRAAGWLCAIQQRFAECYRPCNRRIRS